MSKHSKTQIPASMNLTDEVSYSRGIYYMLILYTQALMNTLIDSGKMYRNNVASSLQASQYTLPASIKLLPLLIIALLKSVSDLLDIYYGVLGYSIGQVVLGYTIGQVVLGYTIGQVVLGYTIYRTGCTGVHYI